MFNSQHDIFNVNDQGYIMDNVPEINFECSDGKPLQLVKIVNKKFEIVPETINFIKENIEGGLSFCSIVGKYRSGKSFLMNKLLDLKKSQGFAVSPTLNSCTRGIWIWSKPIYIPRDNLHIIFIDTEGLDSVDRDIDNDTKLFALTVLLSSYFIYNSIGAIDENSIQSLALISHLIKTISIDENQKIVNEYQLSQYAPHLLWILRDFVLEIRDTRGRPVSSSQYLESALTDIPMNQGGTRDLQKSNLVRQNILNFFRYRDCITLIRPVNDENDLRNIQSLSDDNIRPEFITQLHSIRDKIYKNCVQKTINGIGLTGVNLNTFINQFVDNFNKGKVPAINTAWRALVDNDCNQHYNQAIEFHNTEIKKILEEAGGSMKITDLFLSLGSLRESVINFYNRCLILRDRSPEVFDKYKNKLLENIDKNEKQITETNLYMARGRNSDLLANKTNDFIRLMNIQDKTPDSCALEIQQLIFESYIADSFGGNELNDFAMESKSTFAQLINWYTNNQMKVVQKVKNDTQRNISKNKEMLRIEQEQLIMKEDQVRLLKNDNDYLDKQMKEIELGNNEEILTRLKKSNETLKQTDEQVTLEKENNGKQLATIREQISQTSNKKGCC